ncbi:hypothetical protein ACFRH9_05200 [Peribacillus butanolivorans]
MEYRTVEELMIKVQEAIGKTFGEIDIKGEYTVILSSCRFENH